MPEEITKLNELQHHINLVMTLLRYIDDEIQDSCIFLGDKEMQTMTEEEISYIENKFYKCLFDVLPNDFLVEELERMSKNNVTLKTIKCNLS